MNHLQQSMAYERAYNESKSLLQALNKNARKAEESALERDEEVSEHYAMLREELLALVRKYRKLADDEFDAHKENDVVCDEGLGNLANGIIRQAVWDYEKAVSKEDDAEKQMLTRWKDEVGQTLTGVDLDNVWSRVDAAHERFKTVAQDNIDELVRVSDFIRRNGLTYSNPVNKHHCPMCGSGVYAKTKLKHNTWLVCCSGCMLSEVVEFEG